MPSFAGVAAVLAAPFLQFCNSAATTNKAAQNKFFELRFNIFMILCFSASIVPGAPPGRFRPVTNNFFYSNILTCKITRILVFIKTTIPEQWLTRERWYKAGNIFFLPYPQHVRKIPRQRLNNRRPKDLISNAE
jgi:hypothetical protein